MTIDPNTLSNFSDDFVQFWTSTMPSRPDAKTILEMRHWIDSAMTAWSHGLDVRLPANLPRPSSEMVRFLADFVKRAPTRARAPLPSPIPLPRFSIDTLSKSLRARLVNVRLREAQIAQNVLEINDAYGEMQWNATKTTAAALIAMAVTYLAIISYLNWISRPLPHDLYDIGLQPNALFSCPIALDFESPTPLDFRRSARTASAERTTSAARRGKFGLNVASAGWKDDPQSYCYLRWEFPRPLMQKITLIWHLRNANVPTGSVFTWYLRLPCPHHTVVGSALWKKGDLGHSASYLSVPGGRLLELPNPRIAINDYMSFRVDIDLPTGFYTRYFAHSADIVSGPTLTPRAPANATAPASLSFGFHTKQLEGSSYDIDDIFLINHGELIPGLEYPEILNEGTQPPFDQSILPYRLREPI